MMNDEQKEKKREYDRKWREDHPGYDAERARKYRDKFIANHVCTCLNCGAKFKGYRASYCSPECQKEMRKRMSKAFSFQTQQVARKNHFERLMVYVEKKNLKNILKNVPRSDESDFLALQSYIRRNNLFEYLQSIPRVQ